MIGDLEHKRDVYLHFGRVDNLVVSRFLTNRAQSDWLRENYPALVPPDNPNGTPPSEHSVATVFEIKYNDPSFKTIYLRWLNRQNV